MDTGLLMHYSRTLTARNARSRRLKALHAAAVQRKKMRIVAAMLVLPLTSTEVGAVQVDRVRSCRRLVRITGWLDLIFNSAPDRFRHAFRMSRETFEFVLSFIKGDLEKELVTEFPIPPASRLAICLCRLSRGDSEFIICEVAGVGRSTVKAITWEVCSAIINRMWENSVAAHFPRTKEDFGRCMNAMGELWQFPFCWAAVDGCHIPIKCPDGGCEAQKEYRNFKNFYSIVLMSMVDAVGKFIWASAGYPGNSHDALIFQSTELWNNLSSERTLPESLSRSLSTKVFDASVGPVILADSAFPLRPWMVKPFSGNNLSPEAKYFNYRLSRSRMPVESAYGRLKGKWRILHKKCESSPRSVKQFTLACIVLHNVCIDRGDVMSEDSEFLLHSDQQRSSEHLRELLNMRPAGGEASTVQRPSGGDHVRKALLKLFWQQKQTGDLSVANAVASAADAV